MISPLVSTLHKHSSDHCLFSVPDTERKVRGMDQIGGRNLLSTLNPCIIKEYVFLGGMMMSLIPESYLEPLQWFSEQLKSMLVPDSEADAQVIQKGLILYRQGGVSQLKLEKDGISAVVQDVIKVNVRLDLNILYLSECSCPAEGLCRHQMAVFFQILSHHSTCLYMGG